MCHILGIVVQHVYHNCQVSLMSCALWKTSEVEIFNFLISFQSNFMMEIFHEGIYAITTFLVIYQILQVYGTLIFYLPQFI